MRWRLSLLMFLQYSAPGALVPLFSLHLEKDLGFTPLQISGAATTQALAALIAPLIAGQLADRWLAAERCLTLFALAAGVLAWVLADLTGPAEVAVVTCLFWLMMVPALTLGTSLTFAHLSDPERHFGGVRLWGTVGWMMPGWLLGWWFSNSESLRSMLSWLRPQAPQGELADALRLAGLLALALGLYGFTLPPTPPRRQASSRLAPLAALRLFRGRAFAVFAVCTFGVCATIPFSTQTTPLLLEHLGIPRTWLSPTLTLAQSLEVACLGFLPVFLTRFGLRGTMLLGLCAWALAMSVLALGRPTPLVVGSLGLHGVCICCFLVAGQVFMNSRAQGDVRASVQALFACITGMGQLVGNLTVGVVRSGAHGDFMTTFAVPAAFTAGLIVVFLVGFREDESTTSAIEPSDEFWARQAVDDNRADGSANKQGLPPRRTAGPGV